MLSTQSQFPASLSRPLWLSAQISPAFRLCVTMADPHAGIPSAAPCWSSWTLTSWLTDPPLLPSSSSLIRSLLTYLDILPSVKVNSSGFLHSDDDEEEESLNKTNRYIPLPSSSNNILLFSVLCLNQKIFQLNRFQA